MSLPYRTNILPVPHHYTDLDKLVRYAEHLKFGEIHMKIHHETGLKAIIAVHNLKRGPAIGGCRFMHYENTDSGLEDALRLAYMMSLKAAISNLPHGGAKAVLLKPKYLPDRKAYMEAFGDFVNELNGRYITAVDSGTSPADMNIIASRTSYVTCLSTTIDSGDPSIATALGIRRAIEAAVKFKLNRDNIIGIHVAIQGAGSVGYHLAQELKSLGANLTMCDLNLDALKRCVNDFSVNTCDSEKIYDLTADVFAPCALGHILNLETIKRLKVGIVAGSANNQLAHHQFGILLNERGILYAPDFVINSGGLIYAAAMYTHADPEIARKKVSQIYDTTLAIFEEAKLKNCSTAEIAESKAIQLLQ